MKEAALQSGGMILYHPADVWQQQQGEQAVAMVAVVFQSFSFHVWFDY